MSLDNRRYVIMYRRASGFFRMLDEEVGCEDVEDAHRFDSKREAERFLEKHGLDGVALPVGAPPLPRRPS